MGSPRHGRAVSRLGTRSLKADPTLQIQWSEVETGDWRAVCQCGSEDVTRSPLAVVFGSTPTTRPPSATRASASTVTRAILLSSGPS